jgi:thioredoxin 1
MSVQTITSKEQIDKLNTGISVLNFCADWSKQCEQTNDVFQKLAQKYPTVHFAQIEAEKVPDVTEKYSVLSVPYFVFLRVSFTL